MARRPPAPAWLDQIQFILFYAFNPCDAPISLYAQMARPTAFEIALVFLQFDLLQFVKTVFKPRGMRTRRHGRKGRKNRRHLRGVPEIADLVAERVPAFEFTSGRRYVFLTSFVYIVWDTFDRFLWTVALLEMSNDLIFNTLLGVATFDNDKCQHIARMHRSGPYGVFGGAGPLWQAVGCNELHYSVGLSSDGPHTATLPAGTFSLTFACRAKAITGGSDIAARITKVIPGFEVLDQTPTQHLPKGGEKDLICNATVTGPCTVAWEYATPDHFTDLMYRDVLILQIRP